MQHDNDNHTNQQIFWAVCIAYAIMALMALGLAGAAALGLAAMWVILP